MPDFIDATDYLNPKRPRIGPKYLVFAALLFALWIVARITLSGWVDLLWFKSLGYGEVFWRTIFVESFVFLIASLVTFVVLYGAFYMIRHSHHADLPTNHAIVIAGQPINLSVAPALQVISLVVSVAVALLAGLTMMSDWPTLALFWYAPHAGGAVSDPIFSRPLNFFLFTLPAWRMIDDWLLTLTVATCAVAVLFLVITSGSRSLGARRLSLAPSPWRGLSCTAAFLLVAEVDEQERRHHDGVTEHHAVVGADPLCEEKRGVHKDGDDGTSDEAEGEDDFLHVSLLLCKSE